MANVIINDTNLTDIANAIREKNGEITTYKPSEMAAAILAITGGGSGDGPTVEELRVADGRYWDYNGNWDWFINKYNSSINAEIEHANFMFYHTELESIPFEIKFTSATGLGNNLENMFYYSNIKEIPNMKNVIVQGMYRTFAYSKYLREIPEGYTTNNNWTFNQSKWAYNSIGVFEYCYSLRHIDSGLMKGFKLASGLGYSSHPLCSGFNNCYSLDEITNLPTTGNYVSNLFNNTFVKCSRIKNLLFSTNTDGTAYTSKWTKQTITLSNYIGYCPTSETSYITDYNSGITENTRIIDDVTYEALKNDPDSWTTDVNYSRYNHDSAVATINSLPDCSAYIGGVSSYINTIKFKGTAGALTDGGAINTLTEEEIAVATAKGWTVTLV